MAEARSEAQQSFKRIEDVAVYSLEFQKAQIQGQANQAVQMHEAKLQSEAAEQTLNIESEAN